MRLDLIRISLDLNAITGPVAVRLWPQHSPFPLIPLQKRI